MHVPARRRTGMDDQEARIRELLLRIRDLAQEVQGLQAELRRLVAKAIRRAKLTQLTAS